MLIRDACTADRRGAAYRLFVFRSGCTRPRFPACMHTRPLARRVHAVIDSPGNFPYHAVSSYALLPDKIALHRIGCHAPIQPDRDSIRARVNIKNVITFPLISVPSRADCHLYDSEISPNNAVASITPRRPSYARPSINSKSTPFFWSRPHRPPVCPNSGPPFRLAGAPELGLGRRVSQVRATGTEKDD